MSDKLIPFLLPVMVDAEGNIVPNPYYDVEQLENDDEPPQTH